MNGSAQMTQRIGRMVHTHQRSMLRLAFSYVKNTSDAEDIVQEVFLTLCKAVPVFENEAHEKAWLLRATINRCCNLFKSGWFKNTQPLTDWKHAVHTDQSDVIEQVLSLEEKYRLPMHLHYYDGYTINEIAEITGEKPATIGTRLSRARQMLKEQMGGVEHV